MKTFPLAEQMRWADLAPFVGSPTPSRSVVRVRVTQENDIGQLYACTRSGPPMWIDPKWLRDAPPPLPPHETEISL